MFYYLIVKRIYGRGDSQDVAEGPIDGPEGDPGANQLKPSDRFIAMPVEDGVIFKKIDIDVEQYSDRLSQQVQERFERENIDENAVEDAIEWARE